MSPPEKCYRVYCFDGAEMRLGGDFIRAATDEEAIAKAETAGFGTKREIWDGRRLVAQLDNERVA
jgi:hypothetical protein